MHILKIINKHPLSKGRKVQGLIKYIKWQLGSRIVPGEVVYHWIGGSLMVVHQGDWGFTQNIYCGLQEFEDMMYVLHVVNYSDLFVDIGANIGSYTVLACSVKGARGIAFEPTPKTYQKLLINLRLNNLQNRVIAYEMGLADKEGTFLFSSEFNTANHLIAKDEIIKETIYAKFSTLDKMLEGKTPTIIKMDVEGLETLVINGMLNIIKNPNLHSIIMELNNSGMRYGFNDEDIIHKMKKLDFEMCTYEPFDRKILPINQTNTSTGNVLFLRDLGLISDRIREAPYFNIGNFKL